MKKALSILLSIVILMCIFTSAMPSFALNYGSFSYEIVDDEIVITKYIGSNRTSITVPATINDISVVAIGEGAFKGNTELTSVTVESGIQDIRASAFENCTSLATISLPETIIHIGEKAIYNTAYYNDTSNWKLKLTGPSQDQIEWEDIGAPVLEYLYLGKNLIEIELEGVYTVKSGTLVIADGAFVGIKGATEVLLPTSLVTIGNKAFQGCEKLRYLKNLSNVKYIGESAFEGCSSMSGFDISSSAVFYASSIYNTGYYNTKKNWENGVLYMDNRVVGTNKSQNETIIKDGAVQIIGGALGDKDAIIPATVTEIADNAFTDKTDVKIFGYSGTYAETYANENNIPFVDLDALTKGDVDFNGIVDENDLSILYSVSSLDAFEGYAISIAGDMNEDGAVDGLDAIILDLFLKNMGPSTLKGDANGDGEINEADYELLVKISLGNEIIKNNFMFDRCDLNDDGTVDNFDAMYLDLALNGLVALV